MEATGYYWIKCDLDGNGKRWRLAVERHGYIYFPMEDYEPLDDDSGIEGYAAEFPAQEIRSFRPPEMED